MRGLGVMLVLGTRPEAIKMAPVILECLRRPHDIHSIVCVTGQHREMLAPVVEYFGIRPDIDLGLMTPGQAVPAFVARCLQALDAVIEQRRPDCVVAQGDTATVAAAALASFYRRIAFVHVEAGLRTHNLQSPWPEEFNRRIATLGATMHCAPTARAAANLAAEGVPPEAIHLTGNTVVDALLMTVARERESAAQRKSVQPATPGHRMVLITGHRRESFGEGFRQICQAIALLADRFSDVEFIYPVHLNPEVQAPVHQYLSGRRNIRLLDPVPYPEFVWLMDRATLILTDSGGIQEEAPTLGKPVLVMRDTTERPEAVEAGAAMLVGTSTEGIIAGVGRLLTDEQDYKRRAVVRCPYGDGQAARRIVELILRDVHPP